MNNLKILIKQKKNWKIIFMLIFISFILLISLTRLTLIGQFLDDFFFTFIFGWLKYFIYLFLILFLILIIIKKKELIKLNKNQKIKITWILFNIFWLSGLISIIILNYNSSLSIEETFNYNSYGFEKIIPKFWNKFFNSSILNTSKFNDFFKWNGWFFNPELPGGIIGFIVATIFNYTYWITAIILNLLSFFLMFSYFIFHHSFYFFFKQEKKHQIKWKNLNKGLKSTSFVPETMNQIKNENITVEIPILQKITEKEISNKKDLNFIEKKENEEIRKTEKEQTKNFEWEIPEIKTNEKLFENKTEILTSNLKKNKEKEIIEKKIEKKEMENNLSQSYNFLSSINNFKKIREENISIAKINKEKINKILKTFGIIDFIHSYSVGPSITKFEIILDKNIKIEKFLDLRKKIEIELDNKKIRLETSIFGKTNVTIEVPNKKIELVFWKSLINDFKNEKNTLKILLGKDTKDNTKILDIKIMPHLLIAGSKRSGKSVCLLSIISTLILNNSPKNLKLLLIDPKKVELSIFKEIPHLIGPIINDNNLVAFALKKVILEIQKRYKKFNEVGINQINIYNQNYPEKKIPYLIVIINKIEDLILEFKKEMENKIFNIAQISRDTGIHLILTTEKPSVDIITDLIKSNIPARIVFNVSNESDSKNIINFSGAEKLLGNGDLLFLNPNKQKTERIQGVLINSENINTITNYWINKKYTNYFWPEFKNLKKELENKNLI